MIDHTDAVEFSSDFFSPTHIAYPDGYTLESRAERYSDVIQNIISDLPQPLLDVGCGPGFLVHLLREKGYTAFGCDFSQAALNMTPSQTRNYLAVADISRTLPYGDITFGSSSAFHVLEHLDEEGVSVAIRELARVTLNRFYGIIPTTDGITLRDAAIHRQITEDPTHKTLRPRPWWLERFKDAGWRENTDLTTRFDRKSYGWVFVMDRP